LRWSPDGVILAPWYGLSSAPRSMIRIKTSGRSFSLREYAHLLGFETISTRAIGYEKQCSIPHAR
jgi:hypothetical protein